ncbi:MAG: sigma-70 family RNA polymerase sigma factor [Terracidiphilus sp.]|jgi:RNA polymerase sigma-70 factor (ECF subfamily)
MFCMGKNDHAAVRATLNGDKEAYGALVVRHSQSLFRVAYRITGNEADADDVVQEAFLRGYQKLESFASRSNFGTWIYRIAVRCALDKINSRRAGGPGRGAEQALPEEQSVRIAEPAAGPENLLLSGEIGAVLDMAMNSLTPAERTAFVMRHMEDRTMEEIAEAMGIQVNAAKQAVFRAVQKLRPRIASLRVTK